MLSVTMSVDTDVQDAFVERAQQAPSAMRRAVGQIARGLIAEAMLRELSVMPPKPNYPLAWTSDRQRRFVMAQLRRSGNIPYQRTGKLARGWQVVVQDATTATLAVINNERGAKFVYGPYPYRQRMHGVTGWPFAPVIIVKYEPLFQDALITAWLRHNGIKQ